MALLTQPLRRLLSRWCDSLSGPGTKITERARQLDCGLESSYRPACVLLWLGMLTSHGVQVTLRHLKEHIVANTKIGLTYEDGVRLVCSHSAIMTGVGVVSACCWKRSDRT